MKTQVIDFTWVFCFLAYFSHTTGHTFVVAAPVV
jgi:hypothetical protein